MTLRLVGLMSVVLLLSLAAFGLLVSHYQQGIMEELPRTVSAVGRATLRTLDWQGTEGEIVAFGGFFAPGGDESAGEDLNRTITRRFEADAQEGTETTRKMEFIKHVITASTEDNTLTIRENLVYPGQWLPSVLPGDEGRLEACLLEMEPHGRDANFFIDVTDVRAESDPRHGLILRIPKFTPTSRSIFRK